MDKLILEALKELKVFVKQVETNSSITHNTFSESKGICENVIRAFSNNATTRYYENYAIVHRLKAHFITWPKFSGDRAYPVPSECIGESGCSIYNRVHDNMYIGEYGKLRMELIDYLIEQFEAKVNV